MGRSQSAGISSTAKQNSATDQGNAQSALTATNNALDKYTSNLGQYLNTGRQTYGQSGEFAGDINTISSDTAAAAAKSLGGDLAFNKMRTGANTANYAPTVAAARNAGAQQLTDTLATADQSRLANLNAVNQFGVTASALPAQVQGQLYGTSLGGGNTALNTAESASAASPGFFDVFGQDVAQGAGAAIGAATKACWIAAEVFAEDFLLGKKTNLVRAWLWDQWAFNHWYAPLVLRLYSRLGERASRSRVIVKMLRPLFERALREAQR